jgi:transcription elongation factor GreA
MQIRVVLDLASLGWKVNRQGPAMHCALAAALLAAKGVVVIAESTVGLTADGMQQLTNTLQAFQERRTILADAIASSPGDADEVKAEFALASWRIAEIEAVLRRAQPIDLAARMPGVVGLGSRVVVHWEEDGNETYIIVDPAEVDASAGRISYESPVGQALMGRRAGDRVTVELVAGPVAIEVLAVD